MKKINFKKIETSYLKICVYLFLVAAAVILFEKVVGNLPDLGAFLSGCAGSIVRLGSPFFMGFAIAYLMNPFIKFLESRIIRLFPKATGKNRLTRTFSILINYTIVIGGVTWIAIYLVPELRASVITFASELTNYSQQLNATVTNIFDKIAFIDSQDVTATINHFLAPVLDAFEDVPQLVADIATNLYSFGKVTINFIMAIFISFYMIFDKEKFSSQFQKIILALTNKKASGNVLYNAGRVNHIFQAFIVGKALDSLIIGILSFVGFRILDAPFPLILSLIIGVTNMIPYFGPFIGAIPAVLITVLADPVTALWVLIFIVALQQFDGNLLGPKILGDSLDISPIWIILAVIVGGAVFGPLGMFIGVPIFASVKLFFSEYINRKYNEKYGEASSAEALPEEE